MSFDLKIMWKLTQRKEEGELKSIINKFDKGSNFDHKLSPFLPKLVQPNFSFSSHFYWCDCGGGYALEVKEASTSQGWSGNRT